MEQVTTLQDYIDRTIKAKRAETMLNSDQLTLGQIILKLDAIYKKHKADLEKTEEATVCFDFEYAYPVSIDSWRGSYNELALQFEFHGRGGTSKEMNLFAFLNMMKGAVNKEFTGYKGGEFRMDNDTPVWVANYGNSGNTAVVDIVDDGYQVIIMTGYRKY